MKIQSEIFQNLAHLQNSHVDLDAICKEGRLQVGNDVYKISVNSDGKVEARNSKADKFFALISTKFSPNQLQQKETDNRTNLNSISRILTEKKIALEVRQSIAKRDGGPHVQMEGVIRWAQQCLDSTETRAIYKIYSRNSPGLPRMDDSQIKALYKALIELDNMDSINVEPQVKESPQEYINLQSYLDKDSPRARENFYFIRRAEGAAAYQSNSRLTINVKTEYAAPLLQVLASALKEHAYITQGKVSGPKFFTQRTEAAILYMKGDYTAGLRVSEFIRNKLGDDAFVNHTPFSMHKIIPGISYGEHFPESVDSYGQSRSRIVQRALTEKSNFSLPEKLATFFEEAGYDPQFPSFRKESIN